MNWNRFCGLLWLTALAMANVASAADLPRAYQTTRALLGGAIEHTVAQSPVAQAQDTLQRLRSQAADKGLVRVIVGVRAAFAPEGYLAAQEVQSQREDIAVAQSRVEALLPRLADARARRYEFIPFMALQVDAEQLEVLANSPYVTDVQEDLEFTLQLSQSVPLIRADQAWSAGRTGNGWTVAVLDGGAVTSHPFIASKIVSEACYSSAPNGYDPVSGKFIYSTCPNYVAAATGSGSASARCTWSQVCDHGTHVAGIATGSGASAGVGFSGVAKGANLLPIQVFQYITPDNTTTNGTISSSSSDINAALQQVYALRNTYNIAAVNISIGGSRYYSQASCDIAASSTKAAIDQLRSVGIATVIASGNNSYTDSLAAPGCVSSAISVGAVWDGASSGITCSSGVDYGGSDKVTCYSNSASFLDVLAPGSAINSSYKPSGSWYVNHGTSMAAPHVAGCIAILKEARPSATVDEIEIALKNTGVPVQDYRNGIVKPRIDCKAALDAILPPSSTVSVVKSGSGSGNVISSPTGINCGSTCSANFTNNTALSLTAMPVAGSAFGGWTGACSGTGLCAFTVNGVANVGAQFNSIVTLSPRPGITANLAGVQGALNFYAITVPAGAKDIRFSTSGGSGDVDLYIRLGGAPGLELYDCRPYLYGNNESCVVNGPLTQPTVYYVMLSGASAYTGVSLNIEWKNPRLGAILNLLMGILE